MAHRLGSKWVIPTLIRSCAAAPRTVHAKTSRIDLRLAAGSAAETGAVAVVLKRKASGLRTVSKQNSRDFDRMNICGSKPRERSHRRRGAFGTVPASAAGAAARLHRGVDRHHHPAAVRHHHPGAGVRHPHRVDGRHAADRRPSAGRQAGLCAVRARFPSTFCRTPR